MQLRMNSLAHQQGPLVLIVDNISVIGVALPQMGSLVVDLFVGRTQTLNDTLSITRAGPHQGHPAITGDNRRHGAAALGIAPLIVRGKL